MWAHNHIFPLRPLCVLEKDPQASTTSIILKAALALLIIYRTNNFHALFANMEAARSTFPFLPASIAAQNTYNAVDAAGLTFGIVLNLVTFHPEETVLEYLIWVQQTQALLSEYASVPWHEVLRRLDISGDVVPSVAESMFFNWIPGLAPAALGDNPFKNMQILQTHIRTKLGMMASAAAGGPDGSQIIIYLEGALANTSTVWVARAAKEWKKITLWFSDEKLLSVPVARFHRAIGIE